MAQDFLRRRLFEGAAELCVLAFSEVDEIAPTRSGGAQDPRSDGVQIKWARALPFGDEVFEDRGAAAQGDCFLGESAVGSSVEDFDRHSSPPNRRTAGTSAGAAR